MPGFNQPNPDEPNHIISEINRWLSYHGNIVEGKGIELETPCQKLTKEGSCGVYETRPLPCMSYIAGGEDCLETVRTRRTPEEYRLIRDDNDPESLSFQV